MINLALPKAMSADRLPIMRRVGIVLLVLLILLMAIPLGIGMAMTGCPVHASMCATAIGMCSLLASFFVLLAIALLGVVGLPRTVAPLLLLPSSLEHPPRF